MIASVRKPPVIELRKIETRRPSAEFPVITSKDYAQMLRDLLVKGVPASKKNRLIAIPMMKLQLATLNNAGGGETVKDFDFGHHIVFDTTLYNVTEARAIFRRIFVDYGDLVTEAPEDLIALIAKGEIELSISASIEGVWTVSDKNLKTDYQRVAERFTYEVKPGTGRMCLAVTTDFNMLTTWGDFNVRNGGVVAIRFAEAPLMATALANVAAGRPIEDMLFTEQSGKRRSVFDVYGMDPGFFEANYDTVERPQDISAAIAGLS